jgi:S-formylglutathione hydrolase FrmB
MKDIPVLLGIFIDHGKVPPNGKDSYPRYNRSLEYDGLGDRYARFLLEEILPEVSKSYRLSDDPNDRSIAGASSGAICAFNAAWERPDEFRRVLSTIGTYVGLRGADEMATLVRKTEPKPLRIFLQDGTQDLNIYAGDWWMANQAMLSALRWNGYEVNHAWGEGGGHDSQHTKTILADALKWLWKDYPAPVITHKGPTPRVNPTIQGEPWREVSLQDVKADKLTVNKRGELFVSDKKAVYKVSSQGVVSLIARVKGEVSGLSFHEDGKLYIGDVAQNKIVAIDDKSILKDIASGIHADFLTITAKGIYFSDASENQVGFYSFGDRKVSYVSLPYPPTGLAVSAEQTFLNVGLAKHVFGYSLKILEDGKLDFAQEYIHYHIPYGLTTPGVEGMVIDSDNFLYSATSMGIQLSDQLGRVNFIFSKPGEGAIDVKLGGADFRTLYVTCDGKLFSRKITSKGILPWLPWVKPPKPGM